ncbi:MAG: hypothetical protein NE334_07835 [Lentisphaeraceae bacterium]|nr:hypothetical protein [Lentisphaeraceae bacterium]
MEPLSVQRFEKPLEATAFKNKELSNEDSERALKEKELRKVVDDFESILVTKMVKQGLKTAKEINDTAEDSSAKYMDMAYDQFSTYMGENMNLGLADSLFESMKDKL